ncbi:ABC transporter permease [Paenibacillus aceris]|uniref:ABC transport system permease protein n=1 Tax=Paenibacillus aceris TaxID=869555 RepID=A0ABS4HWG9_9BACL|nr:FtsX-like permease family protein [Paenibacillus aceris]MBP1962855.1 putative ABC transport system permease protein [Paenibacillus aceris]NHW38282.1 FtsX-like permease family protein [Paenibacillus aceris]
MALFIMILRKMINNKWLELSLLFGLVLSVALASSMPIYTSAILQRMLIQEMQQLQLGSNQYPGIYWISAALSEQDKQQKPANIAETEQFLKEKERRFGIPVQNFVSERATQRYNLVPAEPDKIDINIQRSADISAIDGMESHIRLVDGRLPAKESVGGVYEALVAPEALTELGMVLNTVFIIKDASLPQPISIKPVGVFDRKDYTDIYWYNNTSSYKNSFLIDFNLFEKEFTVGGKLNVQSSYWYFALDYKLLTLASADEFLYNDQAINTFMDAHYDSHNKNAPALQTLSNYYVKETNLRKMLWSLNVPVMLMLAFYLFMVANLITERQKTEIAVLRSRGASRLQIVFSYAAEGLVLGAIAFTVGPYLGAKLTELLGASSGFLEFVQRAKLETKLSEDAFLYALTAIAASLVMTLIPVILATRVTIVGHKQQSARMQKQSFWHKFFLDIAIIGISLYGLQNYKTRVKDILSLGLKSADLRVDPLLFLIPAMFILGLGLLVLRLYPLFMKLLYKVGKRWWPPTVYTTLIQVSRSIIQYQFIMVFLIITIATGLFSASATRTINQNTTDKIRYSAGADIVMKIHWENDAPPAILFGAEGSEDDSAASEDVSDTTVSPPQKVQYSEPSFLPFTQFPGVDHAAKVFIRKDASFNKGKTSAQVELMGIDTKDFGETAWLRDKLLDHHIYDYLNLIAKNPSAILISRSIAEEYGVKVGDTITAGWQNVEPASFTVFGIIDYWPSWNPNPGAGDTVSVTTKSGTTTKVKKPMLIVGHLAYIQNNLAIEPYEVWMKLTPESSSNSVYQAVSTHGYEIESVTDAKQEQIKAIKDPFQLAINGVMTLGFIISVVVCFFGFLLYWVLSLSARTLQYGIFRAMGVSVGQLIVMLVGEQVMVSGAAILIGIMTGNLASHLFVPLFELSFDPSTQVPPFQVTFDRRDTERLYGIVTVMITIGLAVLGHIVSRIRIHQAVKLGED